MAHRSFTDSYGTEWQVWDVMPARAERRHGERRHDGREAPRAATERRRGPERRRYDDVEVRVRVPAGLERGWLAFESRLERRRLSPIPDGWEQATLDTLRSWADRAIALPNARRRLIE